MITSPARPSRTRLVWEGGGGNHSWRVKRNETTTCEVRVMARPPSVESVVQKASIEIIKKKKKTFQFRSPILSDPDDGFRCIYGSVLVCLTLVCFIFQEKEKKKVLDRFDIGDLRMRNVGKRNELLRELLTSPKDTGHQIFQNISWYGDFRVGFAHSAVAKTSRGKIPCGFISQKIIIKHVC